MFALVAFFDDKTEEYIMDIWKDLSRNLISKYAEGTMYMRPHITIADYNSLNKTEFVELLKEFYASKTKVEVTFSVLGTFLKTGTLFLSPVTNNTLFDFHEEHHKFFGLFDDLDSLYLPSKWIPHCTIANRLTHEKLLEAFCYCSKKIDIIQAKISEISLLELKYEENRCISAPSVFSIKLK